jgi:hypothetical protein
MSARTATIFILRDTDDGEKMMFDRYFVSPRLNADVSIRHTEERAPTDESVRLLRDMEEKARAEVIASIPVESNGFKATMQRCHDYYIDHELFRLVCELNGKRIVVEDSKPRHEAMSDFVPRFQKLLADRLASEILRNLRP